MGTLRECCRYFLYFIFLLPVFLFLCILGFAKAALFGPFVFLVIAVGDTAVVIGLLPVYIIWSIICIIRTMMFGPFTKCLLILILPILIAVWTVIGVVGSVILGIGYGFVWPVMKTFRAIGREGIPIRTRLIRCLTDGTWSNIWGACTIVRDFADFSFYSYFSIMDGMVEWQEEEQIDIIKPKYREKTDSSSSLGHLKAIHCSEPLIMITAEQKSAVKAVAICDSFFKACEDIGKELIRDEAIGLADLEAWHQAKNKIVHVGIPSHAFLQCFLRSIKSDSAGFLMSDDIEITSVNRPEGRIFDWLYEPMSIMKEQIRCLNLQESEELYLYKLCLYSGDMSRIESWENGGVPPPDKIRRAQLAGIGRRLQGFCLTLSLLPTLKHRFSEVFGVLKQEAKGASHGENRYDIEAST